VGALAALDFILVDPAPSGVIVTVGDSNIVLRFMAWIDQSNADFLKARSRAIRATKMAVEAAGFTLPEPIYRLRLDQLPELPQSQVVHPGRDASAAQGGAAAHPSVGGGDQMSVRPDDHIDERIEAERRETSEEDLLTPKRPIE
jgi:hypothetical protein